MDRRSGKTDPYWTVSEAHPQGEPLTQDVSDIDVCIVGAGISGLTTAYLLLETGKTVVVLDDGPIAAGETERTTAHITNVLDHRYSEIERIHGRENARQALESHGAAVGMIETIVKLEDIKCDFQRLDGYLFLGENDSEDVIRKELETVHELGFTDVALVDELPFGLKRSALRFPHQAQFHILKYVRGLCEAIRKAGGSIHSFEHVSELEDGDMVTVVTDSGRSIQARDVVIATNSPVSDWVLVHTKQAAYRTYAVGAMVPSGSILTALYWDTEEPYHYVRLQATDAPMEELLIVGGEDHRTGQANDANERFLRLERFMQQYFPQAGSVKFRWSGQIYEPEDGLGFIGRDPAHGDNVYITTGGSGNGMTHGTLSGILLTDLISGKSSPWSELYDPSRKPLRAPVQFLKENINSVAQYARKLMPGEVKSVDEIKKGEGAIVRKGLKQVAVYKDNNGRVHELDATCTHMGAAVCWNSCEKSWDCPAHGSRFDAEGHVIDGPANHDLHQAEKEEKDRKEAA